MPLKNRYVVRPEIYRLKISICSPIRSLFRKSSGRDRRARHETVSRRYHMSRRPLQTKLQGPTFSRQKCSFCDIFLSCWDCERELLAESQEDRKMDLSDNDIQRIVERLRPSLPQILQNQSVGTTQQIQSSPTPTGQTSSAATEAAALSQLFRRPSYVQRHRYTTPYQRNGSRRPTSTTTSNRTNNQSGPDRGVAFREVILLPNPLMDNVPRGREKLCLEERGLVVSGHPVSRSLSQRDLISSFEALFAHVLHNVTSNPK